MPEKYRSFCTSKQLVNELEACTCLALLCECLSYDRSVCSAKSKGNSTDTSQHSGQGLPHGTTPECLLV
eukprot:scaffold75447_cov13-Tisochrysis_lutea.AAC.1